MNDSPEIPPDRDDRNSGHQDAALAPEGWYSNFGSILGGEVVAIGPIGSGRTVLNPLLGLPLTDDRRAAFPSAQLGVTADGHRPSGWAMGALGHGKGMGIKRLPINRHSDGKDHR